MVEWAWELVGGIIVAGMGLFTIFAFNVFKEPVALFLITLPLIILGSSLILSWYLTKNKRNHNDKQKTTF